MTSPTLRFLIAIGSFLACVASAALSPDQMRFPAHQKVTLDNGLTVYLLEQHDVPLITVSLAFETGAIHDETQNGLAFLTAQGLLLGACQHTKSEMEEMVDFFGAHLDVYAQKEATILSANFAASQIDGFLALIADIATHPLFPQEEVDKRQKRLILELKQEQESPNQMIGSFYSRFVLRDHPYGNPLRGTVSSVQELTRDQVRCFYKQFYHPETTSLTVVGHFDTKPMIEQLERLFGSWTGSANAKTQWRLPKLPKSQLNQNRILLVDKPDAAETVFLFGTQGIPRNHPDYPALELVNTILGGRFTSWLNTELRFKSGLTYGAGSSFSYMRHGGLFSAFSFTALENSQKALSLALETVGRLHSPGIDDATLTSGKNTIKGHFPLSMESPEDLASTLIEMHVYGLSPNDIDTYLARIESLTSEKVKEVIDRHIPKDFCFFTIVGNAAELEGFLKELGQVDKVQIDDDEFLCKGVVRNP